MQQPALYFPYIHIRDDGWLKAAALYWPSVRRLRPEGYAVHDNATSETFRDAGILKDEDPDALIAETTWDLADALRRNSESLTAEFSLDRAYADFDGQTFGDAGPRDPGLGWIHITKFPQGILNQLEEMGLATRGRRHIPDHGGVAKPGDWIGLHPALAGAYMTSLAQRLSMESGFDPVTDQADLRQATANEDVGSALNLLVGPVDAASRSDPDLVDSYITMALKFVRPGNLDAVAPEDIIKCREDLKPSLKKFRKYVDDQNTELAHIATLPTKDRKLEAFAEHLENTIEVPLRELERDLALHHLEPTRSLLLASSFTPPAAVAGLAAGSPVAATATGIAAAVTAAWWKVSAERNKIKKASPVGFILDARDRLGSKTLIGGLQKVYRGHY